MCAIGSPTTCSYAESHPRPADGPPGVTMCSRKFAELRGDTLGAIEGCGPLYNQFCPWTRTVDNCCVKDLVTFGGTCAPCASLSSETLKTRLWRWDQRDGWY